MSHDEIDPRMIRDAAEGEEFTMGVADIKKRAHRIRTRRRAAALVAPLALAGLAATGYAAMRADDVGPNTIVCHRQSRMGGDQLAVTSNGSDPVEVCTDMWEDGEVDAAVAQAPELLACTDEAGVVRVVPQDGDTTCSKLGMQDLPRGYDAAARRYFAMRSDLVQRFKAAATAGGTTEADACLGRSRAVEITRSTLDAHGFDDWTVVAEDDDADRCWNHLVFDDFGKTIGIDASGPGIEERPYSTN